MSKEECPLINLSNNRYEEIKNTVVNTFEKLKINCVPISGFEIATKLEAKIIPYSAKSQNTQLLMTKRSEDGFSIKKSDGWYVFYNDNKPYGRINNTMTHESGHIVLDHTEDSELAEAEANFFAKFALAPPILIHKLKLKNPWDIVNRFDISNEAAEYALNYYLKWLKYGGKYYKDYEVKLCNLFGLAI